MERDQAEIIVAEQNFHGRTTTIVGFSSEPQYRELFGPYGPGFIRVPFGDASALAAAITPRTAAVLMEPVQAEAGILFPPDGYLAEVRRICTRHKRSADLGRDTNRLLPAPAGASRGSGSREPSRT